MKTYLVTGGAGFIGSNFIHYMLGKYGDSIEIINVDKLTYAGNLENLKDVENLPNYHFVKADICDKDAIRAVFHDYDVDRVIHFAAESHVDRSIREPELAARSARARSSAMFRQTRFTVLCRRIRTRTSMRRRPISRTVPTALPRRPRTCWSRRIMIPTASR